MEEYIFKIIDKYFRTLAYTGTFSESELNKVLTIIIINNLTTNDFRGCLDTEDYYSMERVLNKYYGTGCGVPFVSNLKCN